MPRNGSGSFTAPAADYPAVASTLIESTKYNNVIDDISTAISGSIAADGQTTITANIPMNSKKLTGLAAGTAAGDSVRFEQFASPPAIGSVTPAAITGTTGTFTGAVSGTTGTFTGAVSGTTGTFTDAVSGTTGTFTAYLLNKYAAGSAYICEIGNTTLNGYTDIALGADGTAMGIGYVVRAAIRVTATGGGSGYGGTLSFRTKTAGNVETERLSMSESGVNAFTGSLSVSTTLRTGGYTVATLPTGTPGDRAYITDASGILTFGSAITGGGATIISVFRAASGWVYG